MLVRQLTETGCFLRLSRQQGDLFSQTLTFNLPDRTKVTVYAPGVISFMPPDAGNKDIVLSCGVHGNETAPIEICDKLVEQILTGKLKLAHNALFLFGNLPAMDMGQRFVEENMNRLFSGAHSDEPGPVNAERQRAKLLEEVVEKFYLQAGEGQGRERLHYDLHTAIRASKNEKFAVYPFLHERAHNKAQLAFLLACGVNTILLSESSTTTFSYFTSHQFNAHGFTVELGKVRLFGQNDMTKFATVKASLVALLTKPSLSLKPFDDKDFLIYRVNQVINKTQADFRLNFADDMPNFSDYPAGHLLAEETGQRYFTQYDGEAIVFPNAKVALGQRALLTVVPTRIE